MNNPEPNMHVIAAQLRNLHDDVGDVKRSLTQLTNAITKLALVEERQANFQAAQDRCFTEIATLNARIQTIETKLPEHTRVAMWVDRVTWAALGTFCMYVVKKLGLFP